MITSSGAIERRTPLQDRAHCRIAAILVAAEQVFLKRGYDAATMTDISVASETSSGGIYRYFSDKASVARALLAEYDEQVELRWVPILAGASQMPTRLMVTMLLDEVCVFTEECPAFLMLLVAPIKYKRDKEKKDGLRARLSDVLIEIYGREIQSEALVVSDIFVETVKGMLSIISQEPDKTRQMIAAHYKRLLTAYLEDISLAWKEPQT